MPRLTAPLPHGEYMSNDDQLALIAFGRIDERISAQELKERNLRIYEDITREIKIRIGRDRMVKNIARDLVEKYELDVDTITSIYYRTRAKIN